jgi:phospholipase/lecithinase/hemolysin
MAMQPITHVFCFGDSTSDNGAGFRLTSALVTRPEAPAEAFVLAAPPAYPAGRFTDGLPAVEVLAGLLGAALDDFAVGGALSAYGNYFRWIDRFAQTGLLAQVDAFAAGPPPAGADPAALYVVQLAGNDYALWADERPADPATVEDVARVMADNECDAVRRLVRAGARRLLVIGPKLVSICPWEVEAGTTGLAGGFTYTLNELLPARLAELAAGLGVEIVYFDLVSAWRRLRVAASSYGLRELDRPFIRTHPEYVPGEGDPDEYFFWDESHVTGAVHRVLGEHMAASLPIAARRGPGRSGPASVLTAPRALRTPARAARSLPSPLW